MPNALALSGIKSGAKLDICATMERIFAKKKYEYNGMAATDSVGY